MDNVYTHKILVVEDDCELNHQITKMLVHRGYEVEQCFDGESAFEACFIKAYDLVLLDVMLPKRDGFSLLQAFRKCRESPVMMLTAKGAEEERIKGLSYGADDYLSKPFNKEELLLRIDAIIRRSQHRSQETPNYICIDGLELDPKTHAATANGHPIELTPIQFTLLLTLVQNQGQVLSKAGLYRTVLNKSFGQHDRSLDMHLSRVRRKLSEANWPAKRLQTVHGKGHLFV